MLKILLVEDDPSLGRGIQVNLELEKYEVIWVPNLNAARKANEDFSLDLVILDLGLPDGSGINFLKELRSSGSRIPVIILTAQVDEDSVVSGLQSGANDYIKKPFSQKELIARIKNVLREPQVREAQVRYGEMLVLLDQRRILFQNTELPLNRREFDILKYFIENAELVITRDGLLAALGKESEIYDRTIDSHISHIRARLREAGIKNIKISSVYGVGYRLEAK